MDLEKLKKVGLEVREMNSLIIEQAEKSKKIKSLFKGFQIYISPIYPNPKILFIGINPGSGFYEKNNEIVQEFEPLLKQDTGYGPWAQIESCFKAIGKLDYLDTIVKINSYFISTKNEVELKKLIHLLPTEIQKEFYKKSKEWIKTIINEINPENIICGGTSALNQLKSIFPEYQRIIGNGNVSMGKIDTKTIFLYKRSHSNIHKKNDLINYLSMYLM